MEQTNEINNKGVQYFLNGSFEKAELEYKKALGINENNATVLNNLGLLYHKKKAYRKAIECFQKAIKTIESDTYYLNMANSFTMLKENSRAEFYYIKSLEINSENVNTVTSLALFYQACNRIVESSELWKRLLRSNENDNYKIELAKNYMALGNYEEALSVFMSIKSEHQSAAIFYYVGVCEFNLKNFGIAEIEFKKSLVIEPDNYNTRHYLSINYLSKGDYKHAVKEMELLIKLYPDNQKVKNDLTAVYLNLGEYKNAEKIVNEILCVDPENEKANRYREFLAEKNHQK